MTFDQLEFNTHPRRAGGEQALVSFANGYGASVIRSSSSYGGDQGLYELAVLLGDELCYTTPITDDVLGWLKPEDVTRLLGEIEALPAL
jgi:hypothetical protein